MAFSVTVTKNKIPATKASITDKAKAIVKESAEYMRGYAASIAPKQTGAFAASIYVNGPGDSSDYVLRAAAALLHNPKAHIIPEQQAALVDIGLGQLRNALGQFSLPEAIVASAVEYSLYLEEGTRYMGARPTLRPAAEAARQQFADAMKHVADDV